METEPNLTTNATASTESISPNLMQPPDVNGRRPTRSSDSLRANGLFTEAGSSTKSGSPTSTIGRGGLLTMVRGPASTFAAAPTEDKPTWLPSLLQPRPLVGIASLVLASLCLFASLGLLVGSNGQPTASWTWQPSVFLAILSAVSNTSVQFALAQAIPTAWWYQASRGNTIGQLQRQWEAGQGLLHAIRLAMHTPWLTVATLASVLVIIDGPFLQRASSVVSDTQTQPGMLHVKLAPELPSGFSGNFNSGGIEISGSAQQALDQYMANTTITADVSGCEGECSTTIQAPGVMVRNCSAQVWQITNAMMHNSSASWGPDSGSQLGVMPVFKTALLDMGIYPGYVGPEIMDLFVAIADLSDCAGTYTETTCTLEAAILEYDVTIKGGTIEFPQALSEAKVAKVANNTAVNNNDAAVPITFTALGAYLDALISANMSLAPPLSARQQGSPNAMNQDTINEFSLQYMVNNPDPCVCRFKDPTADLLSDFNNLMFRSGIAATDLANTTSLLDQGVAVDQPVLADQTRTLPVFRSDLRWFAGAAALQVIAIACIIPVFWGWWTLGVNVSMSPFEIANLFGAPLLDGVNSATGSRGVVGALGDKRVQFGAVYTSEVEVGVGDKGVCVPRHTMTVELAVAEAERVIPPRRKMKFDR